MQPKPHQLKRQQHQHQHQHQRKLFKAQLRLQQIHKRKRLQYKPA